MLAADAYFISTAILLNSILISNDQKQASVAKTKNINTFLRIKNMVYNDWRNEIFNTRDAINIFIILWDVQVFEF